MSFKKDATEMFQAMIRPRTRGEVTFAMGTIGNLLATIGIKETAIFLKLPPEEVINLALITHLVFDLMNPIAAIQMIYFEQGNWLIGNRPKNHILS